MRSRLLRRSCRACAIARSAFDDYLFRREGTGGLGFYCDGLDSQRTSRSRAITTVWSLSRSNRCLKAAVIPSRISQRSVSNLRHTSSPANFSFSLRRPRRVSAPAQPIWYSSGRSRLCARVVNCSLDYSTLERLIIRDQHDGEGIWGRWNANGPGTARLFHELQLGQNFDNFDQAKPGDFMKIFWSRQVGRNEHGHSTIFLGTENRPDGQYVRYWSSNVPSGYGEKSVPRSKIAYAIFSRLQTPANLARINNAPFVDSYLASLLRTRSSIAEAGAKCGL